MYVLIIFLPFMTFLTLILWGRQVPTFYSCFIACVNSFISLCLSVILFYEVVLNKEVVWVPALHWLGLGYLKIEFGFLFDFLSVTMLFVISLVSFVVHLYSTSYLNTDPFLVRYMSYISVFTFFMFFLVVSDNLVQFFVGWEGVGLSSYLLISFWYTRTLANIAALKAMLVNRVGDVCLLVGIGVLLVFFGTVDLTVLKFFTHFATFIVINVWIFEFNLIDLVSLFLFLGAMGKSAQLCFHIWLPDAMEGPTPVSALIHAATMVTAGVFLVLRCSFLFEGSSNILVFVVFVGAVTCFVMGLFGIFNNDVKKVVAYSTCSQLGYMMFACGVSNYFSAFFHLFNHAFFKALLFLSMGSVIHALLDEQDMKKMGGLGLFLPITSVLIFIANLALIGIPFFSGFYSKDYMLEIASFRYFIDGGFSYVLGLLAVFCTAFYSVRLFVRVFLGPYNGVVGSVRFIHESSWVMLSGMVLLGIFSICSGFLFFELFLGIGNGNGGNALIIGMLNYTVMDMEFNITVLGKSFPLLFISLGVFGFFYLKDKNYLDYGSYLVFVRVFSNLLYFDVVFGGGLIRRFLNFSYFFYYKRVEFGFFHLIFFDLGRDLVYKGYKIIYGLTWGRFYLYIFFIIFGLSLNFLNFVVLEELRLGLIFYMLLWIGVFCMPKIGWFWDSPDESLYVYMDGGMWRFNIKFMENK